MSEFPDQPNAIRGGRPQLLAAFEQERAFNEARWLLIMRSSDGFQDTTALEEAERAYSLAIAINCPEYDRSTAHDDVPRYAAHMRAPSRLSCARRSRRATRATATSPSSQTRPRPSAGALQGATT
jgi:hypothetical protein